MRIIDVTNGGSEYVVATITERNGADLPATITAGLGTYTTPPATWLTPSVETAGATATVSLLIDDTTALVESAYLWVRIDDTPEVLVRRVTNDSITVR